MLFADATLADGRNRDVRVADGVVAAVEPAGDLDAEFDETVVDAADAHLLPGAVDVHVHFRQPGFDHKETWASGSRSAVAGGVTTVVDQPNTSPPTVSGPAYDDKRDLAADSLVHYGINGGVTPAWDPDTLFERPLFALGEVFLADSTGDMGIDADAFADALARAAEADVPVTVHAEDADRFDESVVPDDPADAGDAAASGPTGAATGRAAEADRWSRYRTAEAEIEAVERAIDTASDVDAHLHVAHTSTPEAVDRVADAPGVTCEVTPHHLLLSRDDLADLGTFGRMNPPLRSESRREALFERVADGTVDVVATDHAPHTVAEKETTLRDAPSGVPGVETMVPLLLGRVAAGDLGLERVRDLVAATPADIFDLPDRGRVAEGAVADLTLVDLDETTTVDADRLHSKCGWTPFEGHEAVFPRLTLVGGEVAYDALAGPESFGATVGENVRG
ncbi:MAG: dihydroorotase [Halolamina sp.]